MEIYLVVNLNGEKVGIVQNDGNKLYLTNKGFVNEFDNIDDIFNYTESNKLHLLDEEGDL